MDGKRTVRSTPAAGAKKIARFLLVSLCLALPTLSLLPLGGLYLWEKGYLLHWAIAALSVVGLVAGLEVWVLRGSTAAGAVPAPDARPGPVDPSYSAQEAQAWRDVEAVARRVDIDRLNSMDAFVDLGIETIDVVARRLHPEKKEPLWQFTVPEAMAIAERVSRRLGGLAQSHIPFGDRLTLAQFRAAYRWRGAIDVAERAYDIWRMARLINPATAMAHEARERLSKAMFNWGREQITRRFAEGFVEEVGRAAIDLYGGRLRVGSLSAVGVEPAAGADRAASGAGGLKVRIAVIGGAPGQRAAIGASVTAVAAEWPEAEVAVSAADMQDSGAGPKLAGEIEGSDVVVMLTDAADQLAPAEQAAVEHIVRHIAERQPAKPTILIPVSPDATPHANGARQAAGSAIAEIAASEAPGRIAVFQARWRPDIDLRSVGAGICLQSVLALAIGSVRINWSSRRPDPGRSTRRSTFAAGRQAATATGRIVRALFQRRRPNRRSA